jgi:hypothetical protein
MSNKDLVALILCFAAAVITFLLLWLVGCMMLLTMYRRKNKALRKLCNRYRAMAEANAIQLRNANMAQCLAETQAAAELARKDRELRINRELMKQFDQSRRKKGAAT